MDKTDENSFAFQQHSVRYAQMAGKIDRTMRIENPDGYGKRTGVCGDTIEMFLTIDCGVIRKVFFVADGCVNTRACANTVASLAEGKTIEDAWELTPQDVVDFLETLPSKEAHCAELAVGAFYLALSYAQQTDQRSMDSRR